MLAGTTRKWLEAHPTVVAYLFLLSMNVGELVVNGGADAYHGPQIT